MRNKQFSLSFKKIKSLFNTKLIETDLDLVSHDCTIHNRNGNIVLSFFHNPVALNNHCRNQFYGPFTMNIDGITLRVPENGWHINGDRIKLEEPTLEILVRSINELTDCKPKYYRYIIPIENKDKDIIYSLESCVSGKNSGRLI